MIYSLADWEEDKLNDHLDSLEDGEENPFANTIEQQRELSRMLLVSDRAKEAKRQAEQNPARRAA